MAGGGQRVYNETAAKTETVVDAALPRDTIGRVFGKKPSFDIFDRHGRRSLGKCILLRTRSAAVLLIEPQ